ncbi:hypothetical protein F4679DRAFT_597519 [Xylaria curta]|nr:hypothetical protein F4679DRAFT_597519 [Xylaria curta]
MKELSDFLGKVEVCLDLDAGIIRVTRIHKGLRAILRLEKIPKEEEFHFKSRSQTLLDKWNILLDSHRAPTPGAEPSSANANGVNEAAGAITKVDGVASEVNDLDKDVGTIVPLFDGPPNALQRIGSHSGDLLDEVKRCKEQVSDEDKQSVEQSIDKFKQFIKQSTEKVFGEQQQFIEKIFDERQQSMERSFERSIDRFERSVEQSFEPIIRKAGP